MKYSILPFRMDCSRDIFVPAAAATVAGIAGSAFEAALRTKTVQEELAYVVAARSCSEEDNCRRAGHYLRTVRNTAEVVQSRTKMELVAAADRMDSWMALEVLRMNSVQA